MLDAILEQDPQAHVACEVTATTGILHVMGKFPPLAMWTSPPSARDVVKSVGYNDPACGFDGNTCGVLTSIDAQSPDIAMGVDASLEVKSARPTRTIRSARGSGHDVRLCLRRNARADAPAHLSGASAGQAAGRGPQGGDASLSAAGR